MHDVRRFDVRCAALVERGRIGAAFLADAPCNCRQHRGMAAHATASILVTLAVLTFSGCTYVGTVARQSYLSVRQTVAPRQRVLKHMVERPTVFVYGEIRGLRAGQRDHRLAVAALSAESSDPEIVDVASGTRGDSYYALNLPDGAYRLVVLCDQNSDGQVERAEAIADIPVRIERASSADGVIGPVDLDIAAMPVRGAVAWPGAAVRLPDQPVRAESLFFPKGTLRSLDDPLFDARFATLGLYQPATFMERAPMLFYALEEDSGYKVPVVFVHGIEGSARQFAPMVAALDRSRYQAWFFHYPSGTDLTQLSSIFHRIFLSGRVIPRPEVPMVIVAHSMGGLIVRDALNRMSGGERENTVGALITIASPLGGHPAAAASHRAPVRIPSWANLDPQSPFIRQLHRRPLPSACAYTLYYTFGDTDPEDREQATDGVVPLSAQLAPAAVGESRARRGYADGHVDVLQDPRVIGDVMERIQRVRSPFPEDHLRVLDRGGYDIPLGPEFTALEAHLVRTVGHYLDAMATGELAPFHPDQVAYVRACRGEIRPTNPAASAWLKLRRGDGVARARVR